MAQVYKLQKFDDLSLIGQYAERFGLDPDEVFWRTSFETIINFLWMWKEGAEYQERYQYIYGELTSHDNSSGPTAGK